MSTDNYLAIDCELQALARASLGGKKTTFLKAACSDELKGLMLRKLQIIRAETGQTVSESEYVERVVAISLLGFDHVQRIEREKLEKLAGHWSSIGQKVSA